MTDGCNRARSSRKSSPQSGALARQRSAFQGKFLVTQLRHVGRYRSPDAAAWITIINAVTIGQSVVDFA
jgi:hypothetical protein